MPSLVLLFHENAACATRENATQATVKPIIDNINTAVTGAVSSLKLLVGQPTDVTMASVDGSSLLSPSDSLLTTHHSSFQESPAFGCNNSKGMNVPKMIIHMPAFRKLTSSGSSTSTVCSQIAEECTATHMLSSTLSPLISGWAYAYPGDSH